MPKRYVVILVLLAACLGAAYGYLTQPVTPDYMAMSIREPYAGATDDAGSTAVSEGEGAATVSSDAQANTPPDASSDPSDASSDNVSPLVADAPVTEAGATGAASSSADGAEVTQDAEVTSDADDGTVAAAAGGAAAVPDGPASRAPASEADVADMPVSEVPSSASASGKVPAS